MKNLFAAAVKQLSWGSEVPLNRFLCQVGVARVPHLPIVVLTRSELSDKTGRLFNTRQHFYIHDPADICNMGDVVLARRKKHFFEFPQTFESPNDWDLAGKEVWFELEKIVHKGGFVVDPISGRKCADGQFLSREVFDREKINSQKLEEAARFFEVDYLYPTDRRPWPLESQDTAQMKDEPRVELEQKPMGYPPQWKHPRRRIRKTFFIRNPPPLN